MASQKPSRNSALYRIVGALDATPSGDGWKAHCPGPKHRRGDRDESLSIGEGYDGRVVINCFAGCDPTAILAPVGLTLADLFEKGPNGGTMRRFKEIVNGRVEAEHCREDLPDGKKMRWERNGRAKLGKPVEQVALYRLPDLEAAPAEATVYLCEGEADTDVLAERGLLAVGTMTGAATIPCDDSLRPLAGRDVVLWADHDGPGREHMAKIAARLAALESDA